MCIYRYNTYVEIWARIPTTISLPVRGGGTKQIVSYIFPGGGPGLIPQICKLTFFKIDVENVSLHF